MIKFVIEGRLDGLNEYTSANRTNKYQGAKAKQVNEDYVALFIKAFRLKPVKSYPVELDITWYETNRKRDVDNITFSVKFIQDALVKCGIIENDSQKYIKKLTHTVEVDTKKPRIEVVIRELGEC